MRGQARHDEKRITAWLPAGLLAALLLAPGPASAEIIRAQDVNRGTTVTREQCDEKANTLWVEAYGRSFCIRYYVSEDGGSGRRPVVYLSGDKHVDFHSYESPGISFIQRIFRRIFEPILNRIFGAKSGKDGAGKDNTGKHKADKHKLKDVDTDDLLERASDISEATGTTAIYLARMGLDGSSGDHHQRRTMLELQVMNAALDALKRRHGYTGFHLVGQSGGSTLIGAILALRDDIKCAVPGSGRLARLAGPLKVSDPAMERLDPSSMIPKLVRSTARILVVTDPEDKTVTRKHQDTFVNLLEQAGGRVEQFYVESPDDETHHGVSDYSIFVADGCIHGKSHKDIARGLKKLVAEKT